MSEQSDIDADTLAWMADMQAAQAEPLRPELEDWVEDGTWGKMLRHPLVYMVPLVLPGQANLMYERKHEMLAEAVLDEDWQRAVFLHERPHRLNALIDYVTGRDDGGEPLPLVALNLLDTFQSTCQLVADVWVDSENIEQNTEEWRAVLMEPGDVMIEGLWLGTEDERTAFDALPDPIPAWRGGIVGDWSWTTDRRIAEFFAKRLKNNREPRFAMIPKADCFGYLTRRGESELLVRLTPEREPLVYPQLHE